MGLLAQGQFLHALPLAERASYRSPGDGELSSYHLICLVNTGQIQAALSLYHERLQRVDDNTLLRQAVATAWLQLGLKHLFLRAMRPIADHDPAAFADMERDCREDLKLWNVDEEQARFEEEAIELYHRQLFEQITEQAGSWLERYPASGKLRAVVAAAFFQLEQFAQGLEWCRWKTVCPSLVFAEVRLLLALGRYRSAQRAGKRLLHHLSRSPEELVFQLMTLLLLNQNRAVLAVQKRARVPLDLPKIQACLASAYFALGQSQVAATHLRRARPFLGEGEYDFAQQTLESGTTDLGSLRGFVLVKLYPRDLTKHSRNWSNLNPDGVAAPKTLREFRKYAEQHAYLRKIAPIIWRFADLPQRMAAFLTLGAYPKNRFLQKHLRAQVARNDMPSSLRILLNSGAARSGVYRTGRDYMVVNSVHWSEEWSPDATGKARELQRATGALMAQKRYPEAEIMTLRALEFCPESTDLLYQLSTILELTGRLEESKGYLERILRLKPDHVGARLSHADWLARHGQGRAALKLWRQVERQGPLWVGYMASFYRAYFYILSLKDLNRSKAWFLHWTRTQPNHPFQSALPK